MNRYEIKYLVQQLTLWTFLLGSAFIFVFGLGLYDFFTRGEAREALFVKDIVTGGEWILPRGYGDRITTKPPFFHWIAAFISLVTGHVSELSIRLASAICSAVAIAFFLCLLRDELKEEGKWLFAVMLIFSFEWLRASLTARVDMAHAASLSSSLLAAYFAIKDDRRPLWVLSSMLLALATLAKGPVAVILTSIILGVWIVWLGHRKTYQLICLGGSAVSASLLALTWYVAAYWKAPQEFSEFFWYENFARFTSTMEDAPHSHSLGYLIGVFLLGLLPWTPLIFSETYKLFRAILDHPSACKTGNPLLQFSVLVVLCVFIFYAIPSSKRAVYLLAAYPFVALATALSVQRKEIPEKKFTAFKILAVSLSLFVFVMQALALPRVVPLRSERRIAETLLELCRGDENIFSYGLEFYGASF